MGLERSQATEVKAGRGHHTLQSVARGSVAAMIRMSSFGSSRETCVFNNRPSRGIALTERRVTIVSNHFDPKTSVTCLMCIIAEELRGTSALSWKDRMRDVFSPLAT